MTTQELELVKKALGRWREATRLAKAAARNRKGEVERIEGELKIIADELAELGVDWKSDQGLDLVEQLLKARLGLTLEGEEDLYEQKRDLRF